MPEFIVAETDPCGANYEPAFARLVLRVEELCLASGFPLLFLQARAPGGQILCSSTDTRRRMQELLRRAGLDSGDVS